MITIGMVQQKGGVGKTVIATNLATSFQKRGYEVALVDADPQGSARDWAAKAEHAPMTVGVDRPVVHKQLPKLKGFDIAIVDGPGKLERMTVSIIKASDLCLIPVQPAAIDLWAVGTVIDHIQTRQDLTEGRPQARFVISRAITGSTLTGSIEEVLDEAPFGRLNAGTYQRVAYTRAVGSGQGVVNGSDPKAAAEINAITDELESILKLKTHA